jgi:hypothetical protein
MVFGWLRRKKKKEEEFPEEIISSEPLPEDLERFRMREPGPALQPKENYPGPMGLVKTTEKEIESEDKMDLILQKLETIDVRLKLLEEKLGV